MPTMNNKWGAFIRELLQTHGLTFRGAMMKAGGEPSHTTIKDWADNIGPHDIAKAYRFLSAFSTEEAIAGCEAAGIPVPAGWREEENNVMRVLSSELRGTPDLPEEGVEQIVAFVRKIKEKYPRSVKT